MTELRKRELSLAAHDVVGQLTDGLSLYLVGHLGAAENHRDLGGHVLERTDDLEEGGSVPNVDRESDDARTLCEDLLDEIERSIVDGPLDEGRARAQLAEVREEAAKPHGGVRVARVQGREHDVHEKSVQVWYLLPMAVRLAPSLWCCDLEEDAPLEGQVVRQHPARAFGSGLHPTTRMCARAVQYFCATERPRSLLDVGAGTGLLARIGTAMGTARVCAVEIDADARAEIAMNVSLDEHPIEIRADFPQERFDVVVANILEEILLDLRAALKASVAPGGRLLLSGFTPEQTPRLITAFTALGLRDPRVSQDPVRQWCLLQLRGA